MLNQTQIKTVLASLRLFQDSTPEKQREFLDWYDVGDEEQLTNKEIDDLVIEIIFDFKLYKEF